MDSPTTWNIDDKFGSLIINSDGLRVNYTEKSDEYYATIRANHLISSQCKLFYFEVEILNGGENGIIGIGFCEKTVNLNKMPGWEDNSWGYYGDDGRNNTVFYTLNEVHLRIAFQDLEGNLLYPCVGFKSQGGSVEVNFGHKKFKYEVEVLNSSLNLCDDELLRGDYEQALLYLTMLLDSEPNNAFALKY
ncbi:ran-binding protein [Rhizophagus clarus]|uniref:Ran-binding protein n=1 Tax=Rhizophagus clarus TaxID=94130 RepID=A0A8H3QWC7_9GLOM|nr:ran-binding protein [Rhizophagus clarus]